MLISVFAWAKDRVHACQEDPDGSICAELIGDCYDDKSISVMERRYCAQRGLLTVPYQQKKTESAQVGVEYIQPLEGDFDYNLTLQIEIEDRVAMSEGGHISLRNQWEFGFLDDLSLDVSIIEFESGYWFGPHVYAGLFFGFGYSFIKNGVLGSALYVPTGSTMRIRFNERVELYARGQVDWPFAWAGERRRRYDSGLGFGHELRSEVGLKNGHFGIAGVHRRFMGGDWVGVQLSVYESESSPLVRRLTRCHMDSECDANEICHPETSMCIRKSAVFQHMQSCVAHGWCSPYGHEAIAVNHASCRMSEQCKIAGECTQDAGGCVARDEDCEKSDVCKSFGLCRSDGSQCVAGSPAHCEKSIDCKRRGACTFDEGSGGQCVISNSTQCSRSTECLLDGNCVYMERECVPTEAKHCRSSKRCQTHGFCRFKEREHWYGVGICVNDNEQSFDETFDVDDSAKLRSCKGLGDCRIYGLCSVHADYAGFREGDKDGSVGYFGPQCTAGKVEHCTASLACTARGACSKVSLTFENGTMYHGCRPNTDADCKGSSWCKYFGRCTLNDGVCVESK